MFRTALTLVIACSAFSSAITTQASELKAGDWKAEVGECGGWQPDVSDLDAGMRYQQTQICKRTSKRERYILFKDENGSLVKQKITPEVRVETVSKTRTVRGGVDGIDGIKKAKDFLSWMPVHIKSCEPWPKLGNQVALGQVFTAVSWCEGTEERRRPVVEFWRSGKRVPRPDLEQVERREGRFLRVRTERGSAETWYANGFQASPPYIASRTCDPVLNSREWEFENLIHFPTQCHETWIEKIRHLERSASGQVRVRHIENKKTTRTVIGFTGVLGTNDYVKSEREQFSDWEAKPGTRQDCFDEPSMDGTLLPWGTIYVDIKQCTLKQVRKKERVRLYATGHEDRSLIALEFRDHTTLQTLTRRGGKDELLSADPATTSEWSALSAQDCTKWQPAETFMEQGLVFSQTIICKQSRKRSVSQVEHWRSGSRVTQLPDETETITRVETREMTGVAVVEKGRLSFEISATPLTPAPWEVVASARQIRVALTLDNAVEKTLSVQIGDVQLDLPAKESGQYTYYFRLKDYHISPGMHETTVLNVDGVTGRIELFLE